MNMAHPLEQFRYCPKCGSAHFVEHNGKSKECRDCGFVYYFNPSAATVAVILKSEKRDVSARPSGTLAEQSVARMGEGDILARGVEWGKHYYTFYIIHHSLLN